jgi:hypothetical protein
MGNFPFMLYNGSFCFIVMYHYKANAILATPITGLDNVCIFEAYTQTFIELSGKVFKPKLNVTNNQATKHIKQFLSKEECKLQLIEPHNHCMNVAKCAIQTFKNAFIAALATTNCNFLLKLWDRLTPQVINCLNMMWSSCINPTKLESKILYGPYDWNCYPLAPLGCKVVIYKDRDTRGLWASRGIGEWYFGPLLDHYQCGLYYGPESRAYRISGSTELFPQHCQLPDMIVQQHFRALTDELAKNSGLAGTTNKER